MSIDALRCEDRPLAENEIGRDSKTPRDLTLGVPRSIARLEEERSGTQNYFSIAPHGWRSFLAPGVIPHWSLRKKVNALGRRG